VKELGKNKRKNWKGAAKRIKTWKQAHLDQSVQFFIRLPPDLVGDFSVS
jgi:hypothetical protein